MDEKEKLAAECLREGVEMLVKNGTLTEEKAKEILKHLDRME